MRGRGRLVHGGGLFPPARRSGRHAGTETLRDRAYTASGYALMAAGEFEAAREDFKRVRLVSPVADRALLGHGWAAFENGDAMAALSPWRELANATSGEPERARKPAGGALCLRTTVA